MALYVSEGREDTADPVPPGPVEGSDPNPIPTETQVRYTSPSGSGNGLTVGAPMALTAALDWLDDSAPAGGTVRMLAGTYNVGTYWFDNGRNLGVNSAYRTIRSHDPNNPINLNITGYSAFGFKNGANRFLIYDMYADGNSTQDHPSMAAADGAQYMIQLGQDNAPIPGKDCHHIWMKKLRVHHTWTGAIGSVGADYGFVLPGNMNEMFLVEDCEFWDNCAGAYWGGSAMSLYYPRQQLTDGQVDNMFKISIDGSTRILGFIFRRNIGYRNFQSREDTANHAYTDGNMVTTDMVNPEDYNGQGGNTYNRAMLIENNISFGNGRFYAATLTHPSAGVWVRFNTSVCDGITYRHSTFGVSNSADMWGGYGGWNNVFRIDANISVYDPTMAHPYGTGAHHMSKDATFVLGESGPPSVPLRSSWNLVKVNASAALGPAYAGAVNTITTDPGISTSPPNYLAIDSGQVSRATVKAWATPALNSSARQLGSPYVPTDGVDCFWRSRGAGTLGAAVPGGS